MILKQASYYNDTAKRLKLANSFVAGAIANIEKVLGYYLARGLNVKEDMEAIDGFKEKALTVKSIEELMAFEGNIRDIYYGTFDRILDNPDFKFTSRSKRPPKNELNALVSFGNSMLYVVVLSEIYKTHLDPRIGFLHTANFRRFSLNLDVAEIFKPIIVDRIIFTLINKKILQKKHFEIRTGGIFLKETGRKIFVEEFDNRLKTTIKHPALKRNVSYQSLLRLELYKLEKHLIGEQDYQPYMSNW